MVEHVWHEAQSVRPRERELRALGGHVTLCLGDLSLGGGQASSQMLRDKDSNQTTAYVQNIKQTDQKV